MTAGKGLGGGVAIGALFGKAAILEAWKRHVPASGESPYASTFYAHPLACAGTLAAVERLTSAEIRESVASIGRILERELAGSPARVRGAMAAVDLSQGPRFQRLVTRGILTLPGGLAGTTCSLLPAFTIQENQLVQALGEVSREL
jgi:acetylornithine/succinyldiaminopimelate/putrescine aminotransferase